MAVVRAATQLIERAPGRPKRELHPQRQATAPIARVDLGSEREEAEFIAAEIERAVGGTSLESLDMGRADGHIDQPFAFREIAVLFRVSAQAAAIKHALDRAGIPHQRAGDALTERPEVAALLERLRSWAACPALERGREAVADRLRALAREASADFEAPAARRLLEAADLLGTLALPFGRDAASAPSRAARSALSSPNLGARAGAASNRLRLCPGRGDDGMCSLPMAPRRSHLPTTLHMRSWAQ